MQSRSQIISDLFKDFISLKRAMLKEAPNFKLHVPPAQKEVLLLLATKDGMSIKEIAKSLGITPGATTQLTEALVQAGLLIRKEDTADRRITHIFLSPKGRTTMQELLKLRHVLLGRLFKDLTDDEIEAFQNVIKKMNQNLSRDQEKKG